MTANDLKKEARKHDSPTPSDDIDCEKRFWLNLKNRAKGRSKDPVYCILDTGTCFDNTSQLWNLSKFTANESIIHALDKSEWFDGIHTSYRYLGMFGTSFAWHREDRNLFSINYLHYGEPKVWYSVPAQFAERLEEAIQEEIDSWPEKTRKKFGLMCDSVTRHKVVHAEPLFLKKHNIPYGKVNCVDYDL